MAHWREDINPEIKEHFEKLVSKSVQHKETYEKAKDKAVAQLWTVNAIQAKELDELRMKIAVLEKAITVLSEKGKIAEQAALKAKFLEKALMDITGKKAGKETIDANKAMREVISRGVKNSEKSVTPLGYAGGNKEDSSVRQHISRKMPEEKEPEVAEEKEPDDYSEENEEQVMESKEEDWLEIKAPAEADSEEIEED